MERFGSVGRLGSLGHLALLEGLGLWEERQDVVLCEGLNLFERGEVSDVCVLRDHVFGSVGWLAVLALFYRRTPHKRLNKKKDLENLTSKLK